MSLFAREILHFLELEKEFQDKITMLEKCTKEDQYHKKISDIRHLLNQKILSQSHEIIISFKKELK